MIRRRALSLLLIASLTALIGCEADPVLPDGRRLSDVLTRLESEQPTERSAALAELGGLGPTADAAVEAVARHVQQDEQPRVRAAAAHCLAAIGTARARDSLLAALADPTAPSPADVAARALAALRIAPDRGVEVLITRAQDDPQGVAAALAGTESWQLLGETERSRILAALAGYRGGDRRTLSTLVERLGDAPSTTAVPGAVELLLHAHGHGLAADRIALALAAAGTTAAWTAFDRLANAAPVGARTPWLEAAPSFARPAAEVDDALVLGFLIAHTADLAPTSIRRAACGAIAEVLTTVAGPTRDAARATLAERLGDADPTISQHVLAELGRRLPADGARATDWQPVLIHAALHAPDDAAATRILTAARSLFAARAPDALLEALELALPADHAAPEHWLDPVWRAVEAAGGADPVLRARLRARLLQDARLPDGPRRAAGFAREAVELPADRRRVAVTRAVVGSPPAAWPTPWVDLLDPTDTDDLELLVRITHEAADPEAARAAAIRLLRDAPARATIPIRLGDAPRSARLLADRRLRALPAAEFPSEEALLYLAPQSNALRTLPMPERRTMIWLDEAGRVLKVANPDDGIGEVPDRTRAGLALPAGRAPDSSWAPGSQPMPDLGRWLPLAR